jgi:glutamate synthase (ferredoxin)
MFLYSSFLNLLQVRSKIRIIIESAEPRSIILLPYLLVASAINPYLVNEIIRDQVDKGIITDLKADYDCKL